ncbi:MAG: hypothetical protein ABI978_06705 [Chloroflexota bacterium]
MKRHAPAIGLDPSLRGALALLSNGRVLVIDSFRSVRCGCATGDITVAWRREQPVGDFVELGPLEGIRVFARRGLLGLLSVAEPSLSQGNRLLRTRLVVSLGRPELWIDYLDRPALFQGAPLAGG